MDTQLILPISMMMGFVVYGLMAKWYVLPALAKRSRKDALKPILLFHGFRYIGLAFLITGVTNVPLDTRFSLPAAYGDLLAAILALLALWMLHSSPKVGIALTWTFNIVGTLDLLNAVFQGLSYTGDGDLGATYFIPALIVPALLVTHYLVFVILLRKNVVSADS